MKSKETMYAKAVLALVDIYGIEYIKSKISNSFLATEQREEISRYYFCFEDENSRKDLTPNYKGWTVYATIDVDSNNLQTKVIEYTLP